jgi:hypothetical protein
MEDAMSEDSMFFVVPPEVARGRVIITADAPQPYKVVFSLGERVLSEHPVETVREGEALIRSELSAIQFTTRQERPDPHAPRKIAAVE